MESSSSSSGAQPSRLMILKMQVENFKSYGGVKEIGPFHKCFSSVVGPNGSGKSNVIDAMLFVFGKKTAKLRLNKLSELIHKSAEYPDLDYARVTVFFQSIIDKSGDEDAYDVVPDSQFTVSRVANKNNTSTYYLDGRQSTFGEVTALLRGKGIDLDHNRFLILQGEVELISQMKPKAGAPGEEGLLEYLEDIIGSNVYVEKIEEQAKIVETVTEARADKIKRVQVAEKEKASLESAKAEAEALMAKDREILRAQNALAQAMLAQVATAQEAAQAKLTACEGARAAVKAELKEAEAAGDGLEKAVKSAEGEQKKAVDAHSAAKAAMEALEAKDAALKSEATASKQAAKRAEEVVNQQMAALESARKAGESASKSIPQLQAAVLQLEGVRRGEQEAHDAVMASLEGETEVLRKQLDAATAAMTPKSDAHQAAATAHSTARTELRLLTSRLEESKKAVAALQAKEEGYTKDIAAKSKEQAQAQAELDRGGARLTAIAAELQACEESDRSLSAAIADKNAAVEEARAALTGAEGAAPSARNPVAEALMKATGKGGALAKASLYGRLSTLGTIADKYDCAVTTACGALANFVVETVDGAKACVQFLKDTNAGRAKFIILQKQGDLHSFMDRKVETPEGVPRLFDLIKPIDPKFRPAFYYGLRDTLVAENLEQARRIAFPKDPSAPRWRVVTVAGELLETSGVMGGGGQARKGGLTGPSGAAAHGGAGSSQGAGITQADVDALAAELAKLRAQLTDVRARAKALQEERGKLDKSLRSLPTTLKIVTEAIAQLQSMKQDMATQIASASSVAASTAVSASDKAEMERLTAEVAKLAAAEDAARAESQAAELKVRSLKSAITDVGGEKVAKAKARLERAAEQLAGKEKELSKAQAEAKSSKTAADKAEAAMEKAKKEAFEAAEKYRAQKDAIARLVEEADPVAKAQTESTARLAAAASALESARAKLDDFHAGLRGLKKAESDAEGAWKEAKEGADRAGKAVGKLAKKIEALSEEYKEAMQAYVEEVTVSLMDEEEGLPSGGEEDVVMEGGEGSGGAPKADLLERARAKIKEPLELPALTPQECAVINQEKQAAVIAALEADREGMKAKVNMQAIKEYRSKEKEYLKRVAELEAATQARDNARRMYDQLRKERLDKFMDGFSRIGLKLKEMYQMITLGGDAELELEDSLDPFEGIRFSVRPPKKSWKAIANLSGGEKTLSSLALVFALHHFKPTPLYVMDEIDAALDFKNVSIVANYIKERTKNAQFIIISLRNNMFELADRLVGIYKTADVTKSVTINPKAIAEACNVLSGQENTGPGTAAGGKSSSGSSSGAGAVAGLANGL